VDKAQINTQKDVFQNEILPIIKKLFNDSVGEVRDCALALVGKFKLWLNAEIYEKAIEELTD